MDISALILLLGIRGKREGNDNNKLADDDDDDYEVRRLNRALSLRYYCAPKPDAPRYAR